ncbi:hypothetical protein C1H46_030416 [Malus baccata]|uniref:Uncharacterized protein n=1 Tax=Malus baccata TaxID=106549 RepID=A0A540LC36_MALBA|nr:hypothetical protein C1H46_030416 [Malus baccata]
MILYYFSHQQSALGELALEVTQVLQKFSLISCLKTSIETHDPSVSPNSCLHSICLKLGLLKTRLKEFEKWEFLGGFKNSEFVEKFKSSTVSWLILIFPIRFVPSISIRLVGNMC